MLQAVLVTALLQAAAAGGAGGQEVSLAPGVSFSGSPSYVSEMATQFRDNGGPLSPYGSHFGLKAEVRRLEFGGVLHFACATGVSVLDYSRTGLMGTSSIRFRVNGREVTEARERRVRFEYYGWTERAEFEGFEAEARVQFLGLDRYLIAALVQNVSGSELKIAPEFLLLRNGTRLALERGSVADRVTLKFAVQPTVTAGDNYRAVLPSLGAGVARAAKGGGISLPQRELTLAPGEAKWFWFIFGYSPDSREQALAFADEARAAFAGPEEAWAKMTAERDALFAGLPKPHLAAGDTADLDLYRMAVTALDNALYAPRGQMTLWACVPTKVHYNWFWLWDSGFEALGYSEFRPEMARETISSIFAMQEKNGFIAHMEDENQKGITPHSQPPVFGFSVPRIVERAPDDPAMQSFLAEIYRGSELFIGWWKQARDENHNGLFEYISQDEGGWDNSPRADYVPRITFINYYGTLGELIGSKVKPLDNVDLNAWMFLYYQAMADWADRLGRPEESEKWQQEALALADRIDAVLWDPEVGCWLDTYNWRGSKTMHHFKVLTPHVWFPAFAGATRDEQKARTAIERHLLNPAEFFGRYPIPIVAYNDPYFDNTKPGWYSSIWIVTAYTALEALWRFGYEEEAAELRRRLLAMMADQDGMKAIYETYDPETGKYKNKHSTGGYASAQFGWSSAFTLEMILERYQEQRFVFADTRAIRGFIRRAQAFGDRSTFYEVAAGMSPPRVEMESAGPLLGAAAVSVRLSDPYGAMTARSFEVKVGGRRFTLELDRPYILELAPAGP